MKPLRLDRELVGEIIATIATCGDGQRECIVYVTSTLTCRDRATGFIHPRHRATAVSTEVASDELDWVWDELRRRGHRIAMQVHSHPGAAHHSGVDDRWPVVHRVGFLSLVVPQFGRRGLDEAHLAVFLGGGLWRGLELRQWSSHLLIEPEEQHHALA